MALSLTSLVVSGRRLIQAIAHD